MGADVGKSKMKSLLDTVEPDAKVIIHWHDKLTSHLLSKLLPTGTKLYSRPKVEALLIECRKQTLLDAAEEVDKKSIALISADELRRMAEGKE